AVVDVTGRQLRRRRQGRCRVTHAVVLFKIGLQPTQNLDGLLHRRLGYINFLEATRQGVVFFENSAVFRVSGRTQTLELTRGQRRLEQVGRIQRAARRRTGADQRVDFVDKQNGLGSFLELLEHRFQALL